MTCTLLLLSIPCVHLHLHDSCDRRYVAVEGQTQEQSELCSLAACCFLTSPVMINSPSTLLHLLGTQDDPAGGVVGVGSVSHNPLAPPAASKNVRKSKGKAGQDKSDQR
eukprot:765700-Hanusia_phi.AAC.12